MVNNIYTDLQSELLVSIVVVTYNSAQFVIETLESAKNQTYKNLELIVTDDKSTDNTIEICKDWISQNKDRFVNAAIMETEKNTGIAANCNRGLYAAKGEWVKFIAGDDILLNNCIYDLIKFSQNNSGAKIIFGKMKMLKDKRLSEHTPSVFFSKDIKEQYKMVYTGAGIHAPANIMNRSFILQLGGFDEEYPFMEDIPLWIKIAEAKEKFYLLDEFILLYRIHTNNITAKSNNIINEKFYASTRLLHKKKIIPFFIKNGHYIRLFNAYNYLFVYDLIIKLGNKNTPFLTLLSFFALKEAFRRIKGYIKKVFNVTSDK